MIKKKPNKIPRFIKKNLKKTYMLGCLDKKKRFFLILDNE